MFISILLTVRRSGRAHTLMCTKSIDERNISKKKKMNTNKWFCSTSHSSRNWFYYLDWILQIAIFGRTFHLFHSFNMLLILYSHFRYIHSIIWMNVLKFYVQCLIYKYLITKFENITRHRKRKYFNMVSSNRNYLTICSRFDACTN